jgi:hypothetical protein
MIQGVYDLNTTVKGDTLNSMTFTMLDGVTPINLTGYAIRMQIRNSVNSIAVKTISIGSGIVVSSPASGVFVVSAFVCDFEVGLYVYDIEFTVGGVVKTYIKGELNITKAVTR